MQIVRRTAELTDQLPQNLHPLLRDVLLKRQVTNATQLDLTVKQLAKPVLADIDVAVELLHQAILLDKNILIVGDFDADGATSTALTYSALKQVGAKKIDFLVPNRFDFGYGLSEPLVDIAQQMNAELIITVDNGIACLAGVAKAKALGISVIVTDHHLPGPNLPNADAIINPNRADCPFPSKNIAGVGVAFYLMLALRAHLRQQNYFSQYQIAEPNFAELLDLVALGTVADVVPLDNINRILVQQGINRIRQGYCRPGIRALLDISQKDHKQLVSSDFGFALGPRLNAAGRLDDMSLGISCLLAPDYTHAMHLASRLDELNKERRSIEASMQTEALKTMEQVHFEKIPAGICLFQDDWHQGVIGILAGRIKERFHRPVVIFAEDNDDVLKGSCRSITGFHIRDALEAIDSQYPGIIIKFGGHAMAAGLSIHKSKFEQFKQAFELIIDERIQPHLLTNTILSDGELQAQDLTVEVADLLKKAMPWGQCFDSPVFDDIFTVAQEKLLQEKHLKLVLIHQSGIAVDAIWFNYNPKYWKLGKNTQMHAAFQLDVNHFRGKSQVQLILQAGLELA
ncbi:single-stranded-DNA-specific exonuclease RecJ [Catenovulum adriaticum]|uniref:Single-stranded-DNA-specific exonuclease RecJ n=1 Tax=Catenovulum adriaticum TaxID=2984846 RepID=A0ABY7AP52_9ALTE|nr:single-stranded-DNA-specific exonuclease RecJ [Catenovulum sp. TS8]WAJ71347.1 single-stranded-DNA-specific exonuclease RecJ [Catenovulum sp. TS8]